MFAPYGGESPFAHRGCKMTEGFAPKQEAPHFSAGMFTAIQVCGFDRAFDLWGCGIFADSKGKRKQDIQLIFSEDSQNDLHLCRGGVVDMGDAKCYNEPCSCNELAVVREKELPIQKIKINTIVSLPYEEAKKLLRKKVRSK